MPADVLEFHREFDATDMTCEQIKMKAREMGWPGIRIDGDKFNRGGKLIVERMSKKDAYGE